jgi:hypothetical protein
VESVVDGGRSVLGIALFIRTAELLWDLPIMVLRAPAARPSAFDNIVDRLDTALGVLLFGASFVYSYLEGRCSSTIQGGFVGRFFDAYGPRVLMIPGTIVIVVSIMITSICDEYFEYVLSQGILFGLGVGMLYVICYVIRHALALIPFV